jgi:hypothetical protein
MFDNGKRTEVVENRPPTSARPVQPPETDNAGPVTNPYGTAPGYDNAAQPRYAPGYDNRTMRSQNLYAHPNADHEQITLASGANLILGLWLIVAPFVLTFTGSGARGNDIILGIVIAVIAACRVFGAYRSAWLSWVNALLGIWVIISPWVLGFSGKAQPTWNNVIVGIAITILGVWSAVASQGFSGNFGSMGSNANANQ